jgi:isoquinoline 1-oxidoreductase alpha subunit
MPTYRFRIDGRSVAVHSDADTPLLHALRRTRAPRPSCGVAPCAECTVQLDGEPVRACTTPMSAVAGHSVSTTLSQAEQQPT